MVSTGANAILGFIYESTFGVEPDPSLYPKDKSFGVEQRLRSVTFGNSVEALYGLANREARKMVAKRFRGTWGVDAILANLDWAQAVTGSSSSPYTPSTNVASISLATGFTSGEVVNTTLLGAVVTRMRVDTRVDDVVRLSFDGVFANSTTDTTLDQNVEETGTPMTFAQGTLYLPNTSALAGVQNASFTFNTNADILGQLGSRVGYKAVAKAFNIDGRFTIIAEDDDILSYLYSGTTGSTAPAATVSETTAKLVFTDGTDTYTFDLGGVMLDEVSYATEINEVIMYDVTFRARTLSIS